MGSVEHPPPHPLVQRRVRRQIRRRRLLYLRHNGPERLVPQQVNHNPHRFPQPFPVPFRLQIAVIQRRLHTGVSGRQAHLARAVRQLQNAVEPHPFGAERVGASNGRRKRRRHNLHIVAVAGTRRRIAQRRLRARRQRILRKIVPHPANHRHNGVIPQVLPHAGQVVYHRRSHLPQMLRRPYPGKHQQLRRCHRPGAQHNPLPFHHINLPAAFHLYPHGPLALKPDPPHGDIGPHRQVEPVPRCPQKSQRRAHPHPFRVIHRNRPHAAGIGAVHIVILRVARLPAGGKKRLLKRQPFLPWEPSHRNRPLGAVKIVADVQIRLHLAEIGQNIHKRPPVVACGGPAVIILRRSPQQHLPVDGAGAAHHLAPRRRQQLRLLRRALRPPGPVVRRPLRRRIGLVAVLQIVRVMLIIGIVRPRFQQQHRPPRILGQPRSHHTARRTGPDNYDIILHPATCHAWSVDL